MHGTYFITINAANGECIFGDVEDGLMHLNLFGEIVIDEWLRTERLRENVLLDSFIVMPNHFHGIVGIDGRHTGMVHGFDVVGAQVGALRAVPVQCPNAVSVQCPNAVPVRCPVSHPAPRNFGAPIPNSLPIIIGSFKSAATRRINVLRDAPGAKVWHRNYYESVVRGENYLNRIRAYIARNPRKWANRDI